ncbi:MAG TPA: hypothetical protein VKV05_06865 [Terriglobales bacterium]|nr:hypothetical protein [Terriglobales bacterium]
MNAQVLEWKLPPYSHLKRSVRELERSAQRGSEMLKRLTRRLAGSDAGDAEEQSIPRGNDEVSGTGFGEVTCRRMNNRPST